MLANRFGLYLPRNIPALDQLVFQKTRLSDTVAAAYLHHFKDHDTVVSGMKLTLDLPSAVRSTGELVGEWIEPATGKLLARVRVPSGHRKLDVPPFTVDLALAVTAERERLQLQRAGTDRAPHASEIEKP